MHCRYKNTCYLILTVTAVKWAHTVEITATSNVCLPVEFLDCGFGLLEGSGERPRRLVLSHSVSSTGVYFQIPTLDFRAPVILRDAILICCLSGVKL